MQLAKVEAHHIPIIALDYLPENEDKKISNAIKALKKRHFIPLVSDKSLMGYSQSSKNAIKREVLIIYNGNNLEDDSITSTNAILFANTPLEYLGYVPILRDIHQPLPSHIKQRYAGVIIWLEKSAPKKMDKLMKWAYANIKNGTKVLFLGKNSISLQHQISQNLGIKTSKNSATRGEKNHIQLQSPLLGYEITPTISYHKEMISLEKEAITLLSYSNNHGQTSTLGAIMPWGGFVLDDALMSSFFGDNSMWIVNPFKLFQKALSLPPIPVPDPTTENGKRLAFVHLDGDGSMNRVESNPKLFSIEVILRDFLKKYHFPQSMSLVESETAAYGKYPKLSPRLEKAAREMYKLPHIEGATHTFTHPYFWKKLENDPRNEHYRTHWNIDYTFTPKREISDSLAYVNHLLPKEKKKAKIVFWSGDCLPTQKTLAYCYKHDILNINGGDTTITNDKPWLQLVQPFGVKVGDYYQVFTGQQNENVYTNDWLGPFWGFKKVIQTFKRTNKPKRLKPIDIYYHFYSASKDASHQALKEVYDWVLKQDVMHIYTSEYPQKVLEFYHASLAKESNQWLIKGMHALRTLRVPNSLGFPSIKESIGVLGYKEEKGYSYVHLDEKSTKRLTLLPKPSKESRLISANARVISHKEGLTHFKGYMPITLEYALAEGCQLHCTPKGIKKKRETHTLIHFKDAKDVYVKLICH